MSGSYVDVYFRDLSSDKLFYYRSYYCQCRTIHGFSRWISRLRLTIHVESVREYAPQSVDFSHSYFSTIDGVYEVVNGKPATLMVGVKINPADQKIYEV